MGSTKSMALGDGIAVMLAMDVTPVPEQAVLVEQSVTKPVVAPPDTNAVPLQSTTLLAEQLRVELEEGLVDEVSCVDEVGFVVCLEISLVLSFGLSVFFGVSVGLSGSPGPEDPEIWRNSTKVGIQRLV